MNRLYTVFSKVFGKEVTFFSEESSPDTVENWDSMNHLNLVVALEEEFQLSITPEDVMDMKSVGLVREILKEYGIQAN